jgi:pimeloyl-ACP methyl ester carboxylesterase
MTWERFKDGIFARVSPGAAEKVLWIHGYTMDSSTWMEVWNLLPEFFHYGIDLPGHGRSEPPEDNASLAGLGEKLGAAAIERGIKHVVGISMGSMVALQVVLAFPNWFETMTLGAPAVAGGPTDPGAEKRYRELIEIHRVLGRGEWMTTSWMQSEPGIFAHAQPALFEQLRQVIDQHRWSELEHGNPGIQRFAAVAQPLDSLRSASTRLLIVIGEHEFPAFRVTAETIVKVRPDARLVKLAGRGHLCILQAPEASAQLIGRHIKGPPTESW